MKSTGRTYQFPDGAVFPTVDSTAAMIVIIQSEDIKRADPTNPFNCAVACALKRQGGVGYATVSATRAYVVMKWKGREVAVKFDVPEETRRQIRLFDETGEFPEGGFRLLPVRPSCHSDVKRKTNALRKSRKGKTYSRPAAGVRSHPVTFRNLAGHIQTRVA